MSPCGPRKETLARPVKLKELEKNVAKKVLLWSSVGNTICHRAYIYLIIFNDTHLSILKI